MASGGIRYDFPRAENFTIGEVRTPQYRLKNASGADITDFTGYVFEWFLLARADSADGLVALRTVGNFIVQVLDAPIDSATPPFIDVPLGVGDWPTTGGDFWHELWRVDAGNEGRLSYGIFPVVH